MGLERKKNEKMNLQKMKQRNIIRINYAQHKVFFICIDVYTLYEGEDFSENLKIYQDQKYKKF